MAKRMVVLLTNLFLAIGFVFHFLKTFVFSNRVEDSREQMIEKEMEKMKK